MDLNNNSLDNYLEQGLIIPTDRIINIFHNIYQTIKTLRENNLGVNGLLNPEGIILKDHDQIEFEEIVPITGPFSEDIIGLLPIDIKTNTLEPRADLIGLGYTLYKMITGKYPTDFSENNTISSKVACLADLKFPEPILLRKDCPEWLNTFILKELSHSPYQNVNDILKDFKGSKVN